jgi:hypothetical protein
MRIVDKIEATLPGYQALLEAAVAGTETVSITPYGDEKPSDVMLYRQVYRKNGSRIAEEEVPCSR